MAAQSQYAELARQLSAIGGLRRELTRLLPAECPSGAAAVLSLLARHGEMRMGRLSELLAIDTSVTSRHVAHVVEHGWVERSPDPDDGRSRILRLTPGGREMLAGLHRRTADMFADRLRDWSPEEVGELITMLTRLRDSFAGASGAVVSAGATSASTPSGAPAAGPTASDTAAIGGRSVPRSAADTVPVPLTRHGS
ncbi:MarR family winged helix-turn-helix transcriptional regulator [Streptomyces sp. CAU 1734]|uniref:MarR family winged helix-turn-helix transcriptional regulator n=1 Tax=Streptomyces sp. CAU 1734 TaxID=3140360 RepID=UPI00326105D9